MKSAFLVFLFCVIVFAVSGQTNSGGLKVNDLAPDFSAMDQYGKNVTLKSALNKGSVVLVFYRGEWCPYCNKQLKELEDSMKMITDKGATVIAISPETSENVANDY